MDEELRDLYSRRLLDLAASLGSVTSLSSPDYTAMVENRLCGSRIMVELSLRDGIVTAYAQKVRACIIGQAAAAFLASVIVGRSPDEVRRGRDVLTGILRGDGAPRGSGWEGLEILTPLKDHPARHASALLPFDAVEKAIAQTGSGLLSALT